MEFEKAYGTDERSTALTRAARVLGRAKVGDGERAPAQRVTHTVCWLSVRVLHAVGWDAGVTGCCHSAFHAKGQRWHLERMRGLVPMGVRVRTALALLAHSHTDAVAP